MKRIIGVRFKPVGKMYYFDPHDLDIKRGDKVIVETSRGVEFGEVTFGIKEIEDDVVSKPLKKVLRKATEADIRRYDEIKEREKEAYRMCADKIAEHGLKMKLVEAEYAFDGSKILFYFTADGRVDFRDLVKDLATIFKRRIELRQIGVRDESKALGTVGMCGRNLCCAQFLSSFMPVSIKMAKEQGLSLNPTKISGACGRLLCCLKYEQYLYDDLMEQVPKTGAAVMTPDGKGTVCNVALLRGRVKVKFDDGDGTRLREYDVADVSPYKPGDDSVKPTVARENRELRDSFEKAPAPAPAAVKANGGKPRRRKPTSQKQNKPKQEDRSVAADERVRLPGNLEAKVERREKKTFRPRKSSRRKHTQKPQK